MEEKELQELSRRAARKLPKNWNGAFGVLWQHHSAHSCGKYVPHGVPERQQLDAAKWLHESTEACTEIMVRVLWNEEVDIKGGECAMPGSGYVAWSEQRSDELTREEYFDDPMLAYRVAVLRALTAL